MAEGVSLADLVQEMEVVGDGMRAFVNSRTGEVYSATVDVLSRAEDGDDAELDWEVEVFEKVREILGSSDWIAVPNRPSHEDYRIMERFCLECCEDDLQDELLSAISGRGAFGRFRDRIHDYGLQDAWHQFRRQVLTEDAKSWLTARKIPFVQ